MLKSFVLIYLVSRLITGFQEIEDPNKPKVEIYKIDGHEIRIAPQGTYEPPYKPIN